MWTTSVHTKETSFRFLVSVVSVGALERGGGGGHRTGGCGPGEVLAGEIALHLRLLVLEIGAELGQLLEDLALALRVLLQVQRAVVLSGLKQKVQSY